MPTNSVRFKNGERMVGFHNFGRAPLIGLCVVGAGFKPALPLSDGRHECRPYDERVFMYSFTIGINEIITIATITRLNRSFTIGRLPKK